MATAGLSYALGNDFCSQRHIFTAEEIPRVPVLLLYFSASWCPLSRAFNEVLFPVYTTANRVRKEVEVILVSKERTEVEYHRYTDAMPWIMVPYDPERVQELFRRFQIKEIPTVLLIKADDGSIIRRDCRSSLESEKGAVIEQWKKQLYTVRR